MIMIRFLIIFSFVFGLFFESQGLKAQTRPKDEMSWPELVAKTEGATASIMITQLPKNNIKPINPFDALTSQYQNKNSGGSGFFIEGYDGVFVTAAYVITDDIKKALDSGNASITIRLSNQEFRKAELIGIDETTGIALMKVSNPPLGKLSLCDKPFLRGEDVVMIGSAFDQSPLVFRGNASGSMQIPEDSGPYEAFNLSVHQGMAGAPILKNSGCVGAIAYGRYGNSGHPSASIGLGVSAMPLGPIIKELSEFGSVQRPFIGISLNCGGLDGCLTGVFINHVYKESPAEKADLRIDDQILTIDGIKAESVRQIISYISTKKAGDEIVLTIGRPAKKGGPETLTKKIPVAMSPRTETNP
jgi:S1-C subfamily serine protease